VPSVSKGRCFSEMLFRDAFPSETDSLRSFHVALSVGDFHGLRSRTSNRPQPSERPLESSTAVEPLTIVTQSVFSVPVYLLR
jgi:hypothetical protein